MNPDASTVCELSRKSFDRFAQFITSELGIKMPESKLTMVQSRLLRRVRELRLESLEHYGDYFFSEANQAEREYFINAITTNKTDFFREPEHFTYLIRTVLPRWAQAASRSSNWRVTAWSAGCSSGEEAYTLAMLLQDYGERDAGGFDFALLATDVSTRVLQLARDGIYPESQVAAVPAELRRKYLLRSKDTSQKLVRVVPDLRRRVSFHRLNFMDEEYGFRDVFDFIFFRNVLIYFDKSTQEAVIAKISRHLAPGGLLFVGHSESLAALDIPVLPVRASIFRKPAGKEMGSCDANCGF